MVPKNGLPYRVASFAPSRSPNVNMFEAAAKKKKWVPGPIYIKHDDWKKCKLPGKFGKYEKITHTAEIMKTEKAKRPIGPASYTTTNKDFLKGPIKPLGNYKV